MKEKESEWIRNLRNKIEWMGLKMKRMKKEKGNWKNKKMEGRKDKKWKKEWRKNRWT